MSVAVMAISGTNIALADDIEMIPANVQIDYSSAVENANGTVTYDVLNDDEVAGYYGIKDPKEVTVTKFNRESPTVPVAPRSLFITNVTGPNEGCGTKEITRNTAYNSSDKVITKNITLTGSVSNTYSTNVEAGINVEVASISAGVGFDVTYSWSMTDSTEVELQPGQSISVYAYPLYDFYNFDIMNDPLIGSTEKVGTGQAGECVGFCTVTE